MLHTLLNMSTLLLSFLILPCFTPRFYMVSKGIWIEIGPSPQKHFRYTACLYHLYFFTVVVFVTVGQTNNKKIKLQQVPISHCLSFNPRTKYSDIFGMNENDGKHDSFSQTANLTLSSHLHKSLNKIAISYHNLWYYYRIEFLDCKICSFFPNLDIFSNNILLKISKS